MLVTHRVHESLAHRLDPFRTRLDDGKAGQERFLITSPEYFHKRLLAAGFEKIFEVARVFRNGPSEMAGLHSQEFFMVEWYRAYASYLEIMEDASFKEGSFDTGFIKKFVPDEIEDDDEDDD